METFRITLAIADFSSRPHSLGKSVEWKLNNWTASLAIARVPTRWGNQLNGNPLLISYCNCKYCVPTRWGNQLNGNCLRKRRVGLCDRVPTRWGNQLNGN